MSLLRERNGPPAVCLKAIAEEPKTIWSVIGLGKPRCDEYGVPVCKSWEMRLDSAIHLVSILWSISSVSALLSASQEYRYWVYSAGNLLIFCTSSCYNVLGVAYRLNTEIFRRLDQAAIFIAFAANYTVFINDWRTLAALWSFAGAFAFLKLCVGRRFELLGFEFTGLRPSRSVEFEILGFAAYAALLVFPMAVFHVVSSAYARVAGTFAILTFGVLFGYLNNYPGGTPLWHACVLGSNVLYWSLVYDAATHGVGNYIYR